MSIFSLFHKRSPDDIYDELAHKIVLSSLKYRTTLGAANDLLSANAGAEIAYLLLHILDRQAYQVLGPTGRDKIIDAVSVRVISGYCKVVLRKDAPQDVVQNLGQQMMNTLNERQHIYSKCSSVAGDQFPGKGTMIFALSFYIHKALGLTKRDDVDDILCGNRNIKNSEMHDFPMADQTLKVTIYFGNILAPWQLSKSLKLLR